MKRNLFFIFMLAAIGVAIASSPSSGPKPLSQQQMTREKARYYYLEGARRQAIGDLDEAFELYKMAYLIDPSYPEAASAYGSNRLMLKTDSLQSAPELKRSLSLMGKYVDKYPGDLFEARTYAYIASRLDSLPEAIRIYERIDSLKPNQSYDLLQLADVYMAAHRGDDALAALQRFETREGSSPQLSMKRMSFQLSLGDTLAARNEAERLIAANPREPAYYILKGNLYEVLGNNDSIFSAFSKAEALNPDNAGAKIALASYYKNIGDSVAYDNKIYEALLSQDLELEDKLGLLTEYLQTILDDKGDTSRGDYLFSSISSQYPHEPKVLDLAARYSAAKGNFKDAEEHISYAVDLDPDNPDYWLQLMRMQYADDRYADAITTYRRSLKHITPTETMTLLYASAATQDKAYRTAEDAYAALIHQQVPDLPLTEPINDFAARGRLNYEGLARLASLYTMLGDMYYLEKDLDKTFGAYDNALFFMPGNPMTLNNYAYFLTENNGDLDKAYTMSHDAVDAEPDNPTYLDTFAWVLFKRKEYEKALEYQEKALEKAKEEGDPEAAEFYSHLGDILFMNHRPADALDNWKKALELEPDNELLKKKVSHKTFFFE